MEDDTVELLSIDKVIKRLRTDLHLSAKYLESKPDGYPKPGNKVQRKNLMKMSILYYLERYQIEVLNRNSK